MAQNVAEDVTGQAWHTKVSLFEVLHLKKQQNISNWNYIYILCMHAYTYEAGLLSDTYVLCNMKLDIT